MSTKDILEQYIKERTKNVDNYPEIVGKAMNTIQGDIPFKLKLAITLSELITFTSHLRKNIKLYDGTEVPANAIVFALSASGTSKDKCLNAVRKSLKKGYDKIEIQRKEFAQFKAEQAAMADGSKKEDWGKYYKAPKPLQSGLGTVEGLMSHFYDISENSRGAGSITSSEIGSELQNNGSMTDIVKTISVAYDLGNIPAKIIKSHENQTNEISKFPVNALFFGSQEAILFDNQIKSKFKLVFNTQLARRSLFSFTPESPKKLEITKVEDITEMREAERNRVFAAQQELDNIAETLVENSVEGTLEVSDETMKLFDVYLEYNNILSEEMSNKFPIAKLSRKHKQWLSLKLAGNYALLDKSNTIKEKHYCYAINTVELLANDLIKFEQELVKEPYEQLVDSCKYQAENGEFFFSIHELRKMSYITGNSPSKGKIQELCTLANSYDPTGSYTDSDTGIIYKEIVKSDIVGVTYKIFDTDLKGKEAKEFMSKNSADGYSFVQTEFTDIENLLVENAIYSCFKFLSNTRKKENLTGGTKFVILDVDKSVLTDKEAHILLGEYNHYIVRTSDENNEFKFRVIVEMDAIIDVDEKDWKTFVKVVADELGLIVDLLPKSQIFLSFSGREILKQFEGKPLESKPLLEKAYQAASKQVKPASELPTKEKNSQLQDIRTTFAYAFESEPGERSKLIYRALAHAIVLGADEDYIKKLGETINDYISVPIEKDRLYRTLINPAMRRIGV